MAVAQRAGPSAVKKAAASVDGRRLLACRDADRVTDVALPPSARVEELPGDPEPEDGPGASRRAVHEAQQADERDE